MRSPRRSGGSSLVRPMGCSRSVVTPPETTQGRGTISLQCPSLWSVLGGDTKKIRVVLADDTREVRILLRLALETHGGFEIVGEADDGVAAIEQSRALAPDLVLLDLAMPRMDGLEALPDIRKEAPEAKVVVLSGLNAVDSAAEAMAAGAHAYLEKGASANDVITTLLSVCAGEDVEAVAE